MKEIFEAILIPFTALVICVTAQLVWLLKRGTGISGTITFTLGLLIITAGIFTIMIKDGRLRYPIKKR